jgi:hypothetical protein
LDMGRYQTVNLHSVNASLLLPQPLSGSESAIPSVAPGSTLPQALPIGLYDARFEHESCGVGFVATLTDVASHRILEQALEALGRLAHRGAIAADGVSSDGIGICTAIPRELLHRACC